MINIELINALCYSSGLNPGAVREIRISEGRVIYYSYLQAEVSEGQIQNLTDEKGNHLLVETIVPIHFNDHVHEPEPAPENPPPAPNRATRRAAKKAPAKKTAAKLPRVGPKR